MKKKVVMLLLILLLFITSCKKIEEVKNVDENNVSEKTDSDINKEKIEDTSDSKSENDIIKKSGYDTSNFNVIKGYEIESYSNNNEILIWMGRQTCTYCSLYAPILNQVQNKYNFKSYYIDLYSLFRENDGYIIDDESLTYLSNIKVDDSCDSRIYDKNGLIVSCDHVMVDKIGTTPLTFLVKNGKLKGIFSGYASEEKLESILVDWSFIQNE